MCVHEQVHVCVHAQLCVRFHEFKHTSYNVFWPRSLWHEPRYKVHLMLMICCLGLQYAGCNLPVMCCNVMSFQREFVEGKGMWWKYKMHMLLHPTVRHNIHFKWVSLNIPISLFVCLTNVSTMYSLSLLSELAFPGKNHH